MAEARIIKRYANRKLYDTQHSRYVTLEQISEMIRHGDEVKIVDNKTKEDLTSVTLAQIIFEEEKKQRSFLPLGAMRNIIQNGGEWFAEAQRRVTSILPIKRKDGEHGHPDEVSPDDSNGETSLEDTATYAGTPRKQPVVALREWVQQSKATLEEWQKRIDGRVRTAIEGISPFAGLHKDVKHLADRIAELETKLSKLDDDDA